MRTFIFIIFVVITGAIVLSMLVPLIAFVLTLGLLYYGIRHFILADTLLAKIGFAVVALIGLSLSLSNSPALVGLVAAVVLYYVVKAWQKPAPDTERYDWITEN